MKFTWQHLLTNQWPVIGPWLQRWAVRILAKQAHGNHPKAAFILAHALTTLSLSKNHNLIFQALMPPLPQFSLNQIWQAWQTSRHPSLTRLLSEHAKPASAPDEVRWYSQLQLGKIKSYAKIGASDVEILVKAIVNSDPHIAQSAQKALLSLKTPMAIDRLCLLWKKSRSAQVEAIILTAGYIAQENLEARVYSALLQDNTDILIASTPEMINWLTAAACEDTDNSIAYRANKAIRFLQDPEAVERFCALWAESRHPLLENALLYAHYLPNRNPYLRLLCALKIGELAIAQNCPSAWLHDLLNLCQDKDANVAQRAWNAICWLTSIDVQEALCDLFISSEIPQLSTIMLASQYLPQDIEKRAIVLFLSEQWEQYETLDMDHRIMRTVYQSAQHDLRERILKTLQSTGKTKYLNILMVTSLQTSQTISHEESQILVRTLTANQEWSRLWDLCFQLEPHFCLEIIQNLTKQNWRPTIEIDQIEFLQLKELSNEELPGISDQEKPASKSTNWLPIAIPKTTLKLHGRANCLAFAPESPHLAIGSGSRRVLIWDYKTATPIHVFSGFQHAIGQIAFLPNGNFVCSERTNSLSTCKIYNCNPSGEIQSIGSHQSNITALIPLRNDIVFSCGRDRYLSLWNTESAKIIYQKRETDWPRFACVTLEKDRICLLGKQIELLDALSLNAIPVPRFRKSRNIPARGIMSSAAFSSDGETLVAGHHSGDLVVFRGIAASKKMVRAQIGTQSGAIKALAFLNKSGGLISAGSNGQFSLYSKGSFALLQTISSPHNRLITLQTNSEETVMASGGENEIILWDLRGPSLASVFTTPINLASHQNIELISSFLNNPLVSLPLQKSLKFVQILLGHRFRFDIHLGEAPIIQPGEFDIVLE